VKRKINEEKIKVVFKQVGGLSKKEVQQRWNKVFDILFSEVVKNKTHGKRP